MQGNPLFLALSGAAADQKVATRPTLGAQRAWLRRAWDSIYGDNTFRTLGPHAPGTLVTFKPPIMPMRGGEAERTAIILWRYLDRHDRYTQQQVLAPRIGIGMPFPDCLVAWQADDGNYLTYMPYIASGLQGLTPSEEEELALYRECGEEGAAQPAGE